MSSAASNASSRSAKPATASIRPGPAGYRLLIMLPKIEQKTEGGIFKPDNVMAQEKVGSVVGFVLEAGPDAYKDTEKFPSGPWCKEGDWVIMAAYSGVRLKVHGEEFRLINDDQVMGTVEDPRGVERV